MVGSFQPSQVKQKWRQLFAWHHIYPNQVLLLNID